MEPTENAEVKTNENGQFKADDKTMLQRAVTLRHYLRRGYHRKEICIRMQLTFKQYSYTKKWMGDGFKNSNSEAFADFMMGEQSRLDEIEKDLLTARAKEDIRGVAALHKVAAEVRRGIYEMALKLGVLQRELLRIETNQRVRVCFGDGDEAIIPDWLEEKRELPALPEAVN